MLSGLAIFDVNKYILMAAPRCLQIPIEIGNQWTLAPKITYEIVVLYNSTRKKHQKSHNNFYECEAIIWQEIHKIKW